MDFSSFKLEDIAAAREAEGEDGIGDIGAFNGFSLNIADHNALAAIFDIAGLQMGQSGDDLRQSAPMMMRLFSVEAAKTTQRSATLSTHLLTSSARADRSK